MNLKKKNILICAFVIALIVALLLCINSITGNPVSNMLAKKAVQQYIDENYKELNMQIKKCNYNFKFSSYYAFVQSSISKDTAFSIAVDSFGNVLYDNYKYEIANNFTTFRRLDSELRDIANQMIRSKLNNKYNIESIFLGFIKEADLMKLKRDMTLDIHNPVLPLNASIEIFSDNISYNEIAKIAKDLESVLKEEDIPVAEYDVIITPLANKPKDENHGVSWEKSISISSFPANLMNEENLPQIMEEFESNRIYEMNKNDKK